VLTTADLCDRFPDEVELAEPLFRDYGGIQRFAGPIQTVEVFEDNTLVRGMLETQGLGRVLVIDGGGSLRCALVGGRLAALAQENGWSGLVVNGAVRDSEEIRELHLGVRALNTSPRRSVKGGAGAGVLGGSVRFAGVTFVPGQYLYADPDGTLLSRRNLLE
jgi:regulator of ribonuclease activity A